ncbi:exodeoxyribonuclease V subunit beta [Pseudidiomarina insulisalsae]|uniref:RecBCD enzyme subunit RecB n=1 Tax=Pseudidiomarina insulisalsae TaxID=575789 RepID=A0A432YQE4_9GAMM|nr:exodeoxyribonuclease V subunit beta [Pseudidiomarina insulisalsae]RUO63567.1 exodeoxyribonuclease V subunit beta [Pseudidiomarina insulisalsae]
MTAPQQLQPLNFPLRNSHLIEASAGTGKTYTIAALYLRLVLGHDPQDEGQQEAGRRMKSPPEILVVTFTDAATEELRDRIRARLTEAAAFFRSETDAEDQLLSGLRAAYAPADWPAQARILELAAQQMDEAAVSTIHGWCNRMLSEHAFASGSLFTQTLNTDNSLLWQQAAQDYWRTFIASLSNAELDKFSLLTRIFKTPDAIVARCRELQHVRAQGDPQGLTIIDSYLQAKRELQEQFHDPHTWRAALEDFQQHFVAQIGDSVKVDGRKLRRDHLNGWLAKIAEWITELEAPEHQAPLFPELTSSAQARLTPEGLHAVCKTPLQPEHLQLPQLLAELAQTIAALPDPEPAVLRHAANWLQLRFRLLQQQRAEIGFDDMLTRLRDALREDDGRLAAQLRQQFPIAMIDEFQDTDPVQYEIFDRIYQIDATPEGTAIFLIGDPKQAIYSFRNADIFTYLQARRATTGRHHTLGTNFRSTTQMVNSINELFSRAEESPQGAFRFKKPDGSNEMPFYRVAANGLKKEFVVQGDRQKALGILNLSGMTGNNAELDNAISEAFAEYIVTLLNDSETGFLTRDSGELQRVQPQDIAILVSTGYQAQLVRQALRKRQLRSVYLSERDSVFAGRVALELYTLLNACAYPRDPRRLRGVLGCELLGLNLAEIEQINADELRWDEFAVRFSDYHETWQRRGVLAMLQQLLHDFGVPARLLSQDHGERELTDLLHLAELLQQQAQHVEGVHGLLRFLLEHIDQAQQDNNRASNAELQVRLESDAELIQVVTIHKSKGLQYPLVFLPFVSRGRDDSRMQFPQRYHDAEGKLAIVFDKDDEEAVARVKEEAFAEELRKLYVATTRAQYATFIAVAGYNKLANSALHYLFSDGAEDNATPDFSLGEYSCDLPAVAEALSHYRPPMTTGQSFDYRTLPAGFGFKPWWMASYSALRYGEWVAEEAPQEANLKEGRHDAPPELPQQPVADSIHGFPRGAEAGTFLHELLENAATEGFGRVGQSAVQCQAWLNEQLRHSSDEMQQQALHNWLYDYLHTPFSLGDDSVAVKLAELQRYQAEPEFWFPAREVSAAQLDALVCQYVLPDKSRPRVLERELNGMLKGFIDLVFEWRGTYYVADYKSNYLGPDASAYTSEAMEHKILESRYDLQFVLYTLALHKLLKSRLGKAYDYDQHVGGSLYLFLRGYQAQSKGAFYYRPPRELIERLEECFAGQEVLCS